MHFPLYVLDTSVLTQAARTYYAFDIAATFWERLTELFNQRRVISIDRVKDEIDEGKDDLKDWTDAIPDAFRSTTDQTVLSAYAQVIQWANSHPQYTPAAKAKFADKDNADAWVVAFAIANQCTVVSQETSAPASKVEIKLPDVCRAFNIECINTFEMLRRLKVKL